MSDESGFKVAAAYVEITADDTGLREQIAKKIKEAADGLGISVGFNLDPARLREEVAAAVKLAGADEHVDVGMHLDDAGLPAVLAELSTAFEDLTAHAQSLQGGFSDVESAAHDLHDAHEDLAAASQDLGASFDDAGRAGDDLAAHLDNVGGAGQGAGAAAGSASGGFLGLSGGMAAAMAAAIALGPALAALPAILGGLGLGGIAAFGALKDVTAALSTANQSAGATGQTAAQAAQTAFSNAIAIQNAEQAISDAKRQSAIAAQNSADSIAAANQSVINSEAQEAQAAQSLAQAQADALNQIADLNNGAADAKNGVADANLAVQQAQQNLTAVMSNSLSTDLQKAQAQQALVDAQQRLADAQQHATEASQAADKANQEGVANFPPVVAAQKSYTQAVQATADAQHQLAVAQRNASDQQISSAEQVQKAETNLTDTLEQQKLAAAAAASSGAGGASAYAAAMAKLTPVGQQVVEMLRGMNDGFSAASQNAFLPGVLAFLKDVQPLLPQFVGMVSEAGKAFGGFVASVGKLFTDQTFVTQFFSVLQQGVAFMSTIGGGVVQMLQGVTSAASAAGPIVAAIGQGIAGLLGSGLPDFLAGLTVNGQGAADTIQSVLGFVSDLLGPLGTLVGTISGALGPVLIALRPVASALITSLVNALIPSFPALTTALTSVANILQLLLPAVTPLIGYLGTGLAGALKVVSDLFQGLNVFVSDNIGWLKPLVELIGAVWTATKLWAAAQWLINAAMDANPIGLLLVAIAGLVGGVVYAYDHFQWFRDFIQETWTDLKNWFGDGERFIEGVWNGIIGGAETVANGIQSFFGGIPRFVSGAFSSLVGIVKDPINGVIWLVNQAISFLDSIRVSVPSWIPGIGGDSFGVNIPQIPYLADGGTSTQGGWAVVGDRGPEAMWTPPGAVVQPLQHHNQAMPAQQAGSGGVVIQNLKIEIQGIVDLTNPLAMDASARKMVRQLNDALKNLNADYA